MTNNACDKSLNIASIVSLKRLLNRKLILKGVENSLVSSAKNRLLFRLLMLPFWKPRSKLVTCQFFGKLGQPLRWSQKESKGFPNFFYSINLSIDKVYNAKNIFWVAHLYRKKGRKATFDFDSIFIYFLWKISHPTTKKQCSLSLGRKEKNFKIWTS